MVRKNTIRNKKQSRKNTQNKRQQKKQSKRNLKGGNRATSSTLCLSSKNLDDGHLGRQGFHANWDTRYCGKSGGGKRNSKKNNRRKNRKRVNKKLRGGMALLKELVPAGDVPTPNDVEARNQPSQGSVGKEDCNVFHDKMMERNFGAKQPFWNANDL